MITEPFALTPNMPHRRIGEAIANGTTHDAHATDMVPDFGEGGEEESHVRERPGCNKPWSRMSHECFTHSSDGISTCDRTSLRFGQEFRSIETSVPWSWFQLSFVHDTVIEKDRPWMFGACTALRQNGFTAPA